MQGRVRRPSLGPGPDLPVPEEHHPTHEPWHDVRPQDQPGLLGFSTSRTLRKSSSGIITIVPAMESLRNHHDPLPLPGANICHGPCDQNTLHSSHTSPQACVNGATMLCLDDDAVSMRQLSARPRPYAEGWQ